MSKYKHIYLDFDGVVCDTNELKKRNIFLATSRFVNSKEALAFTDYFTKNNGLPREKKIFNYFHEHELGKKILDLYNILNKNLIEAFLIEGLVDFLNENKRVPMSILSGGDRTEISEYLKEKSIIAFFDNIFCGPNTKEENLLSTQISRPALFIGDSAHDYEVAKKFKLDFIFLYGSSQETQWNHEKFPAASIYENFKHIKNI
jgi:phosphoglycolate phosphatase-like HAD superfamily hydrolase